jgi:GH18 family chitinase
LDYAITALTNTYGVDPQKITAGVAFYGRTVKTASTPGLHVSTTGVGDNVTFWEDDGTPLYYNIQAKMNLFSTHWDNTAKVPYLTGNGSLYTFVSYDDTASIRYKAQYIIDKNLRGAIIWEITGDYLETSAGSGVILGTPLVDTLNSVLCHYSSSGNGGGNNGGGNGGGGNANGVDENNANTSQLFPNPATHFINVQSQQTENQWVLYSVTGAIVLSGTAQQAVFGIPLDAIESGLYFLRLNDEPLQQIMVTK